MKMSPVMVSLVDSYCTLWMLSRFRLFAVVSTKRAAFYFRSRSVVLLTSAFPAYRTVL